MLVEQIQQEMMVIFDKLETLDETALPTLEGIENASESSLTRWGRGHGGKYPRSKP